MAKPLSTPHNTASHEVCAIPHLCDACLHQDHCANRLPTPKFMMHCLRVCQQFVAVDSVELEPLLCHKKGGAV